MNIIPLNVSVYSSGMGSCHNRHHGAAHRALVLWLPHEDVLEEAQGQGRKEGIKRCRRSQERPVAGERHEGKGASWFGLQSAFSVCVFMNKSMKI